MSLSVSGEMRAKMAALGDYPILDSVTKLNGDGSHAEVTQGTKGDR